MLGRIALQKCGECRVRLGAPTKVVLDNGKASEPKRIVGLARDFGERRIRLSAGEQQRGNREMRSGKVGAQFEGFPARIGSICQPPGVEVDPAKPVVRRRRQRIAQHRLLREADGLARLSGDRACPDGFRHERVCITGIKRDRRIELTDGRDPVKVVGEDPRHNEVCGWQSRIELHGAFGRLARACPRRIPGH